MILDVPRCSLWSSATSISDGIFCNTPHHHLPSNMHSLMPKSQAAYGCLWKLSNNCLFFLTSASRMMTLRKVKKIKRLTSTHSTTVECYKFYSWIHFLIGLPFQCFLSYFNSLCFFFAWYEAILPIPCQSFIIRNIAKRNGFWHWQWYESLQK